jgi:pimeloyl-ACP methyl ester carboxylesterase
LYALLLLLLAPSGCVAIPIHTKPGPQAFHADLEAIGAEWVEVPAGRGSLLRGIYVRSSGPPVLLLYGSGMGVFGDTTVQMIRILYDGGYSVLCCDYRGTGHSEGKWGTSLFLDDDARALWEWLITKEKGEPAGVLGISVGAIAAAPLLSHSRPPEAVVLDRPVYPGSVTGRFIEAHTNVFGRYIAMLVAYAEVDVDMRACLQRASTDTLLVLPEYDALCPPKDREWMISRASKRVRRVTLRGGHVSSHLIEPVRWREVVLDFLDARLRPGRPPAGGRTLPPDPALVERFELQGRDLFVRLDRDDLPGEISLLVCGLQNNYLIPIANPRREMTLELPAKAVDQVRRRCYGLRVVPEGFRPTVSTSRIEVPPPE